MSMFVAVLIALALLGGATWCAQNDSTMRNRRLGRTATGVLLGSTAAVLAAGVLWGVVASL
jgi:hypothetical protein